MEAGKEANIPQDKTNNYKEFQDVFLVKQVFQASVFQVRQDIFQVRQVNGFQASDGQGLRQGFEARARVSTNFNGQEKRVLKQTNGRKEVNKTKHK
jgi:hypothetical protein